MADLEKIFIYLQIAAFLDAHTFVEEALQLPEPTKNIPGHEASSTSQLKLVCYYTFQENGSPLLPPGFVDMKSCTHIIVGFAAIREGKLDLTKTQKKVCKELFLRRRDSAEPTLMLSVGGGGNGGFGEMAGNTTSRLRFVSDILSAVQEIGFDGIDIDWEFPAFGQPFHERFDLIQLLTDLRKTVRYADLLISVAVAAQKWIVDRSYRVYDIARLVDFINLMAYDFHSFKWYLPVTGLNAPLYRRYDEHSYSETLNTQWSALYWLRLGVPKEKLVVGVPTYGTTFTLAASDQHGIGAPSTGFGRLWTGGQVPYAIVCAFLQNNATRVWDSESRVPYAYRDDQWISYDDEESLQYKTSWVKDGGFGGVMVFDLNCDDYNFVCGNKTFPLLRAIQSQLFG